MSFLSGPRKRFPDQPQRRYAGILLGILIGAFAPSCTLAPADRTSEADAGRTEKPAPRWTFDTGG